MTVKRHPPTFQGNRQAVKARHSDELRELAKTLYVTDQQGLTAKELATDERLRGVPQSTIERWRKDDGWNDARAKFRDQVQRRVMAKMQTAQAHAQIAAAKDLNQVRNVLLGHIHGVTDSAGNVLIEPVQPKSLEGAVRALKEVTVTQMNLGKQLSETALGGGAEPGARRRDPLAIASGRGVDEVRKQARLMTQKRRSASDERRNAQAQADAKTQVD